MENLPDKISNNQGMQVAKKDNPVDVCLYNPKPGTKAIDLRRKMAQLPEVAKALGEIDRFVFIASTKTLIADIDDLELVNKTKKMFRFIAMDVGCKIPTDNEDWTYICTRLFTILKRYYSQMTLADVKLAFELSVTGELDEFLPRMANGQADKNHYQQFNAEYFGKILNAYKSKQSSVFIKAQKALPAPEKSTNPAELLKLAKYHNDIVQCCKMIFLKYKYFGKLELSGLEYMFVYSWLLKFGFADVVKGTKEDRERGFAIYLKRIDSGSGSKWDASQVRREGTDSSKIDFTVYEVAREKEIKRAFGQMVEEEIYINNYLDYMSEGKAKAMEALEKYFEPSEKVTAQHVLYNTFVKEYGALINKFSMYVMFQTAWGSPTGKDEKGDLGYHKKTIIAEVVGNED
jgi:hypothetical protein